ncbi:hypothetical protein BpHYR1_006585 [Brachionus plicatilis]|uniref:Uncharacterized protein n=1 Tax=Brachionus plicatilis TaxID=10195 RepID=A0A3M7PIT5_BRAPC|nr:hypothetical protein BpHYR1_006585 [Brachionus plicatilis]
MNAQIFAMTQQNFSQKLLINSGSKDSFTVQSRKEKNLLYYIFKKKSHQCDHSQVLMNLKAPNIKNYNTDGYGTANVQILCENRRINFFTIVQQKALFVILTFFLNLT